MKIHLVDGTYELFRAFYGPPPRKAPDGREVGATIGLLSSLLALLSSPGVTHVACAFDHVVESFRNDLFAGYKTGAGIDPELFAQFPLAEQAVRALGLVTWPMVEFEADDAIATAAERFKHQPDVEQVVICSPDKDLAQLVEGERVVCWDRRREIVYDEAAVVAKYGVPPASI
ncbi:MAG: 5'-3' exonuclease, partial [Anaerolineales bacterium]